MSAERLEPADRAPIRRRDFRSGEHLGLALGDVIVKRLEVKPSDERTANMLAAVACAIRRHEGRLGAGGFHRELRLAALFQGDEPPCGIVDAVWAGCQQTMILVQYGAMIAHCRGDTDARLLLHG